MKSKSANGSAVITLKFKLKQEAVHKNGCIASSLAILDDDRERRDYIRLKCSLLTLTGSKLCQKHKQMRISHARIHYPALAVHAEGGNTLRVMNCVLIFIVHQMLSSNSDVSEREHDLRQFSMSKISVYDDSRVFYCETIHFHHNEIQ